MKKICRNAIEYASRKYGIDIFEIEVMPDHIHLFVRLPKSLSVQKAFQLLKGYTSYHIRKFQPWRKKYKAMWSSFTFSRTVGSVTGEVIKHYINNSNTSGRYGYQKGLDQF
jgi:putative transposase